MSVRILTGDCRARMAELPEKSIQCCVTSPPYFGLRSYGTEPQTWADGWVGELGQEPTLAQFIAHTVEVFTAVWRVLRDDATLWLNIGDSFSVGKQGRADHGSGDPTSRLGPMRDGLPGGTPPGPTKQRKLTAGFKPKDLMMVPARLAIALQADGWYLRSDVIWHKLNPMPESTQDRPTSAHEHVFLLTKNPRYYYDQDAVRTPVLSATTKMPDGWNTGPGSHGSFHPEGREKGAKTDKQRGHGRRHDGFNDRWDSTTKDEQQANGANLRNVWTIATQGFPDAHFAVFPEALIVPCIKAGSRPGDTILDPFGGSGTTGVVADRLGRDAILIELNPEYAAMSETRVKGDCPMFAEVMTS